MARTVVHGSCWGEILQRRISLALRETLFSVSLTPEDESPLTDTTLQVRTTLHPVPMLHKFLSVSRKVSFSKRHSHLTLPAFCPLSVASL